MPQDRGTERKFDSQPENVERTGKDTFNVEHDDGSIFECKVKTPEALQFMKKASSSTRPATKDVFLGLNFDENGRIVR